MATAPRLYMVFLLGQLINELLELRMWNFVLR